MPPMMNRAPMMNRPMMNRPMTAMNRVSSAPAATPGISALLAGNPMQQPMQQPVRQDVSSMGLGSLPQAGVAGFANPYLQLLQQAPQGQSPYGAIQTGELGSQPIPMGPPSDFQGQQQAQQQLDRMLGQYGPPQQGPQPAIGYPSDYNGYSVNTAGQQAGPRMSPSQIGFGTQQGPQAQQNQMGTLANLSQMFNTMGQQQPAQQGGTPLQNNSSPLQQSAQPVMNPGVM